MQTVTASLSGRAVGDFVQQAQARVASQVGFPRGTCAVFGGEAPAQRRSQRAFAPSRCAKRQRCPPAAGDFGHPPATSRRDFAVTNAPPHW